MIDQSHTTPWYRQFWPWFIIALPAASVVAGISLLVISMQTEDTLVTDDYYKEGLAINQNLKRENKARSMGLNALINFNKQGTLQIIMGADQDLPAWPAISVNLSHPTQASKDMSFTALIDQRGNYVAQQTTIPAGRWYIKLEAPGQDWRLNGVVRIPHDSTQVKLDMDAS